MDEQVADRFAAFVAPHLDAAYNLARWLTRNPHDADDVVQEAYLRAFRFFGGFRGGDGRAWLLSIVRNSCYTWMEQNRHTSTHMEYNDESASLQFQDDTEDRPMHQLDPEQLLLKASRSGLIEAALRQLPVEYREILVLREFEELSYKQIGEIAGIPLGTVMSRLSRARLQLRRCIEAME